jgi:hypothetical protein
MPGVWAVLLSSRSPGITRTPVCFHSSGVAGTGGCNNCSAIVFEISRGDGVVFKSKEPLQEYGP